MTSSRFMLMVLAVNSAVFGMACKKKEAAPPVVQATPPAPPVAFHVTSITLGKTITPDKTIAAPTASFGPTDTIFVSVATEGTSSNAVIQARFTFQNTGQLVNESSQTIAPSGPANTEFHIAKPGGWPLGKYMVQLTVNSLGAGSREFEVKKD
jgi:hypothetical protein